MHEQSGRARGACVWDLVSDWAMGIVFPCRSLRESHLSSRALQETPEFAAQLHGLQSRWRDGMRAVQNFASRPFEVVRAVQLPELMLQLDLNGFYQRVALAS